MAGQIDEEIKALPPDVLRLIEIAEGGGSGAPESDDGSSEVETSDDGSAPRARHESSTDDRGGENASPEKSRWARFRDEVAEEVGVSVTGRASPSRVGPMAQAAVDAEALAACLRAGRMGPTIPQIGHLLESLADLVHRELDEPKVARLMRKLSSMFLD